MQGLHSIPSFRVHRECNTCFGGYYSGGYAKLEGEVAISFRAYSKAYASFSRPEVVFKWAVRLDVSEKTCRLVECFKLLGDFEVARVYQRFEKIAKFGSFSACRTYFQSPRYLIVQTLKST